MKKVEKKILSDYTNENPYDFSILMPPLSQDTPDLIPAAPYADSVLDAYHNNYRTKQM